MLVPAAGVHWVHDGDNSVTSKLSSSSSYRIMCGHNGKPVHPKGKTHGVRRHRKFFGKTHVGELPYEALDPHTEAFELRRQFVQVKHFLRECAAWLKKEESFQKMRKNNK